MCPRPLQLLLICLLLTGCGDSRPLVATPNLYLRGQGLSVFDNVAPEARNPQFEVLYVTDRAVSEQSAKGPRYGQQRNRFLSYGSVTLNLDPAVSWETLVAESVTRDRLNDYQLRTDSIRELGTLKSVVDQFDTGEEGLYLTPQAQARIEADNAAFIKQIEARLDTMHRKDVYLYVHGFANTFDDAVYRMAFLWHLMGRTGVPIAYSWPAGYGGPFGYFHDRESGEYTVLHLKRTLTCLAQSPKVERIHIIAHSRGADVATTALRELNIASRARNADPLRDWKIQTLVLCSPDMDAEVFAQRVFGENLLSIARKTVIYSSPRDAALAVANWLFSGRRRIGQVDLADFTPESREKLKNMSRLEFIHCKVSGFSTSHDYTFAHPAVLSDMILLLRDGRAAGAANGRPLDASLEGVWQLHDDYPQFPSPP